MYRPAPITETELLERAGALAGRTLANVALSLCRPVPEDLRQAKGWVGELLERVLGATAGSLPEPDFTGLGIELKTIPVGQDGRPKESTYVCVVPQHDHIGLYWENSLVKRKLSKVLWIPVEAEKSIPLPQRRLGAPLLWSPSTEQENILRTDFEELMEFIAFGQYSQLTAHYGKYLQIRPKAVNSKSLTTGIGSGGNTIQTLPRGFYLRASFTAVLLRRHYALP